MASIERIVDVGEVLAAKQLAQAHLLAGDQLVARNPLVLESILTHTHIKIKSNTILNCII